MIRLVAVDIDDTLLNGEFRISEENLRAVRETVASGVVVTLATGRMYCSASPFAKQLSLDDAQPMITYNGAMTKTVGGQLLHHIPLRRDVVLDAVALAEQHGWTLNLYYEDKLYVAGMNDHVRYYERLAGVAAHEVGSLGAFVKDGNDEISKMLLVGDADDTARRLPIVQEHLRGRAEVVRSKGKFIEITDPQATKGVALARVADELGISAEEVMAIGDSGNDVSMLRFAGVGVAVGNAQTVAREAAAFVTAGHDQSGVAAALRRFCKLPSGAARELGH